MVYFFAFLGFTAALRILELIVSRRNKQAHGKTVRELKEPLFVWMVLLHISFFVVQPLEWWWLRPSFGGWLSWLAIGFTAGAMALRLWTIRSLGISWNVKVVYGDHYPICTDGPFRYIRHPNYLAVILELAFIPLIFHLFGSAVLLTLMNALVLRVRIRNEETVLRQNPAWVAGMAHKPRFLPDFH